MVCGSTREGKRSLLGTNLSPILRWKLLAHAFENVYLDVGLAVNFTGSRSHDLVARSFELAPFTKVLYSSDAFGPAELHYLGARLWRNAITKVIGGWIDDDDCSEADAGRIVQLAARDNARRVYALP